MKSTDGMDNSANAIYMNHANGTPKYKNDKYFHLGYATFLVWMVSTSLLGDWFGPVAGVLGGLFSAGAVVLVAKARGYVNGRNGRRATHNTA